MAEISAALVKELREMTGAGMMDCKRALVESDGDLEKAKDWLRQHGMAQAEKKAGRSTDEGMIEAYLHSVGGMPPKVGVLVEVNCESDFVAKTDDFRRLARELALQVAGARPLHVRREDVPKEIVERELEVYRGQAEGKPAAIVDKIVQGKLDSFFGDVCLLEQAWIRDEKHKKKVSELIAETVAKLGENITVARFARFAVGESSDE
ncbi:MAG: translation elongation factor Ts [Candidatus Dormiibacterota bacterium]